MPLREIEPWAASRSASGHERPPEPDRPLRASMDYEGPRPPDYPNQYREPTPKELAAAATARRLEREEISATSGLVAGHDFKREAQERERGR